jgi:alpha-glucosidase
MRSKPLLFALCLASSIVLSFGIELKSPDGSLVVTFDLKDLPGAKACPTYSVTYKGKAVIAESRLGLELEGLPLTNDFRLTQTTRSQADTTWKPVWGERDTIRDHYNQMVVDLAHASHYRLQLTFRAYDEGAAFCYTLPEQGDLKDFTIAAEDTRFHFNGDYTAWAVYRAQMSYDPNDPGPAGHGGPVPLSKIRPGVERPLTVKLADDLYASVSEAKTVDYARMKLRPATDQPYTLEAFLGAESRNDGTVKGVTPFSSPWRVIMVAESPGQLLEQNYLILNLNDPCVLADTSWIRPGKVLRDVTLSTAGGKACVDFCVERGLQFVEYDAGWYGPEDSPRADARAVHLDPKRNPDPNALNLHEVIGYAQSRGIGIILYVNHVALERQADELFPLYRGWGVQGVKFGFVNVGSQHWTSWLHEAIRKAATNHIMVDIHDEFRLTGYQRTYPNLMTVEGICGNESSPTPVHNATLPFTRFLTGPGDYTFCWYSPRLKVTHAHQLAISTIFFSPWQFLFWYDRPSACRNEKALEYWKDLPTAWDETRVVQAEIGKYVSVARRKGRDWYLGSIHANGRALMKIPLTFLTPGQRYQATIYSDQNPDQPQSKDVRVETKLVDSTTMLEADIPANGGQAVRFVPVTGQ